MKDLFCKLRILCKKKYRFDLVYSNNQCDKNNGYWYISIYPYIKGYEEFFHRSRLLKTVVLKGEKFLEKDCQ